MNKIKGSIWVNAPLHKKTEMYFQATNMNYVDQCAFWNNWRKAFEDFEKNYVNWSK